MENNTTNVKLCGAPAITLSTLIACKDGWLLKMFALETTRPGTPLAMANFDFCLYNFHNQIIYSFFQ